MNEHRVVAQATASKYRRRSWDVILFAVFAMLAGFAEVVTGFTHDFFGITTASVAIFTYSSAAIGVCYAVAGFLILTMRKWAATAALVLLGADIVGCVALVVIGLYPTDSLKNTLSIIAGTLLIAMAALYIGWKPAVLPIIGSTRRSRHWLSKQSPGERCLPRLSGSVVADSSAQRFKSEVPRAC